MPSLWDVNVMMIMVIMVIEERVEGLDRYKGKKR
jgi:hypothetical protein